MLGEKSRLRRRAVSSMRCKGAPQPAQSMRCADDRAPMTKPDKSPMLNLTHVRSFVFVIDEHGHRAAAKALALSPSTVVEHVRQLEEHLAAPLLERAHKGVKLSTYGLRFLPYARALIATASRARKLIKEPRFRVAAASNIGVYLLQPSIAAFRRQTGVEVEMWIAPNRQVA